MDDGRARIVVGAGDDNATIEAKALADDGVRAAAITYGLTPSEGPHDPKLHAVFDTIASTISSREEVSIAGFGKFASKDTPERDGRNPSNGETIKIAASRKLTFTVAKAVKDKLNG